MSREEAVAMLLAAGIPSSEIRQLLVPDPRMEAAERLARHILRDDPKDDPLQTGCAIKDKDGVWMPRGPWEYALELARKVLGG